MAGADRARSRDLGQLRRLAVLLRPYRLRVLLTLLALLLAAGSVLSLGIGLRHLVDGAFVAGRPGALDHGLEAVLIVILVLAGATFCRSYLVTWIGERVVADLRQRVYAHMLAQSPAFFEETRTGEVLSRLITDTAIVQGVIGQSVTQALRNVLLVVGGLGLLLVSNPRLTGLVCLVTPLVVLPIVVIGRMVRRLSHRAQARIADASAVAEESLNAVRTVQAFAQEPAETARFGRATESAFAAAAASAMARGGLAAIVIALVLGAITAVLWIGGHDVVAGRLTAGELSAFIFYATVIATAVGGLSEVMGDLQRAAGALERLFQLLDSRPLIQAPPTPLPLPAEGRGAVRFEHVRFAYPAHPERAVLADLDLDVRPGERLALVGPSGAGKTSLFHLLMRFYDPVQGRVLLDGQALPELDPRAFRARIALVPQEPVIFAADGWTNIRYGRPDASDAEVRAAADAAAASEFLDRLPNGFATFLGEKGVRLSGGQRQRLALARALLTDPRLLLLDEATSALDAENERLVQLALDRLMAGRTSITIAHRLATVLRADRIIVLEEGRIVEQGRHEDLVDQNGLYARLARLQLGLPRAA